MYGIYSNSLIASQEKLPRFLFRAFGARSGGDYRLNTQYRITPRGFLRGKKPTNIYNISNLGNMVERHYRGQSVSTEFSSWAACIEIARMYYFKHSFPLPPFFSEYISFSPSRSDPTSYKPFLLQLNTDYRHSEPCNESHICRGN